MLYVTLCLLLNLATSSRSHMQGFIVGGTFAKIKKFPYAAYLAVSCVLDDNDDASWGCGASVVNQKILLTAAHCVDECRSDTFVAVRLGSEDRTNATLRSVTGYLTHGQYDEESCACDIALVKISRPLKFSARINRVAILQSPPYSEPAFVAGWGRVRPDDSESSSKMIKSLDQKVKKSSTCMSMYDDMPKGTICASSKISGEYPAQGDSGSGLVVREYIQIGIVSYKVDKVANDVIIYTDVGYFYNWITYNVERLYCHN